MGENKGQTIFLSVIGIATLLVAIVGATFAYFTTTMTGDAANVTVTSAKISGFTFEAASVEGTTILPGWTSGEKEIKITRSDASDFDLQYECKLNVTTASTIGDLYVFTTAGTASGTAMGTSDGQCDSGCLITGTSAITLFSGTIGKSDGQKIVKGTYNVKFKETGTDQNDSQGDSFYGTVSCNIQGTTVYFNNSNKTGTTTAPAAEDWSTDTE